MTLKFRAWNKETKKIISHEKLKNISIFALKEELAQDNLFILPMMDKYEIMQFTGLKDKNKVEIYEGDILKVASNRHTNYISFNGNLCYVKYDEDHCCFIATTVNGYNTNNAFQLNCNAEIEVIGNIHENPELLTQNAKP